MTKTKIYIAGKITGDPGYKEKFAAMKKNLQKEDTAVMNPAELPEGMRPADYMKICLAMIDAADIVYFHSGYSESRGACIEMMYCQYIGKETRIWSRPTENS